MGTPVYRGLNYTNHDREFFGDMNSIQREAQPFIMDLVTKEKLFFQTIPDEITESSDNTFVAIATPGRNNPRFQYTGGDDTLEMTITFYSDHHSRQDVIKKVKWLQALGKNNGYEEAPHEVLFSFGVMFKASKFLIVKAIPTYKQFNREYLMLPMYAAVTLTFKRVTDDNRKRDNILKYDT